MKYFHFTWQDEHNQENCQVLTASNEVEANIIAYNQGGHEYAVEPIYVDKT